MSLATKILAEAFNQNEKYLKRLLADRDDAVKKLDDLDGTIERVRWEQEELSLTQNKLRMMPTFNPSGTTHMDGDGNVTWKQDE